MPACFQCSAQCTVSERPQLRLSCSGKLGSACFVHQVNPESTIFHLFCIQVLYFSESKISWSFVSAFCIKSPHQKTSKRLLEKTERKDQTKTFFYVFFVWNQKTSQRLVEANCKENRDWKNSCAITRPLSKQAGNGNIQKQIDKRSQNRGM